jgi:hypothetical protein
MKIDNGGSRLPTISKKDQTLPTYRNESLNSKLRTPNSTTRSISSNSNLLIKNRRANPTTIAYQYRASSIEHWKDYNSLKPNTIKYRNENSRRGARYLYRRNTSSGTSTLATAKRYKKSKHKGIA